jgi:SAM-dependent methyltransferase
MAIEDVYRSGERLRGDDFEGEALARWYAEEEEGYFGLVQAGGAAVIDDDGIPLERMNWRLAKRFLDGQSFDTVLAYGTGDGRDMRPFAHLARRFIAVEPQEQWWKPTLHGTPAQFIRPGLNGELKLPAELVDLTLCFGVLHHVAKVSSALAEIHRTMRPGARMILREPCSSMGDWTVPRRGATRNERGISREWMEKQCKALGFRILLAQPCAFAPLQAAQRHVPIISPRSPFWVSTDLILAKIFRFNDRYWRMESNWHKFAPGSYFYVLEKNH